MCSPRCSGRLKGNIQCGTRSRGSRTWTLWILKFSATMNSKVKEKQWITNEAFFPLWVYKTAVGTIPPGPCSSPWNIFFHDPSERDDRAYNVWNLHRQHTEPAPGQPSSPDSPAGVCVILPVWPWALSASSHSACVRVRVNPTAVGVCVCVWGGVVAANGGRNQLKTTAHDFCTWQRINEDSSCCCSTVTSPLWCSDEQW